MENVRLIEQKLFRFGLVGFPCFYNASISIFLSLGWMSESLVDLGKQRESTKSDEISVLFIYNIFIFIKQQLNKIIFFSQKGTLFFNVF